MDFILAHSRYKRRKFDEAIELCDKMLAKNNKDEAAWVLKCQCLIKDNYIDELETEEDNLAEIIMQDNDKNGLARAGTSFKNSTGHNPIMRPMTNGRINTGFQRVGTSLGSRAGSQSNNAKMLRTGRVMTKSGIPTTSNGRILRLSTASLEQYGDNFFDSAKADLRRIAQSRSKSRLIFLYLFYVEHNMRKALELAIYATEINNYSDPWWKLCLGKCYYQLSFLPQAQKQLLSSINNSNSTISLQCALYLSRIYRKQDNVQKCIKVLNEQIDSGKNLYENKIYIYLGRLYDELQLFDKSYTMYQNVLSLENCHVEAVANIASYYFYKDQPQISTKLYQRLVDLGYDSPEVWNNIALCAYANNRYEQFYHCFDRALKLAEDDPQLFTDVWYNIGNVYATMGELQMSIQAYQLALSYVPENIEALNNLGVINWQQGKKQLAINYSEKSFRSSANFQAAFNLSLWYFNSYQYQRSHHYNKEALKIYPQHAQSIQILSRLKRKLNIL